jgi:hypothetical protein
MSGRARFVAAGAAVVTALLVVPTAAAKVWFSGVPGAAAPGTRVKAQVMGCEAAPACRQQVRGVRVFLARADTGRASSDVPPRPRWLVGRATETGKLTFAVPNVRSGRYRLVARLTLGRKPQYLPASTVLMIADP